MEEIVELLQKAKLKYGPHVEIRFNEDNGIFACQIHDWFKEMDVAEFIGFSDLRDHLNN